MIGIFGPSDIPATLARVRSEHDALLGRLVQPLLRLAADEAAAINAVAIAGLTAAAWETNQLVLHHLLPIRPHLTLALPSSSTLPSQWQGLPTSSATHDEYGDALMLLAHLARDWSADGALARRLTHGPVIQSFRRSKGQLRVLVPGAGMCRLAWELARRGHRVEANDVSASMLVAAHSVMTPSSSLHLKLQEKVFYAKLRCETGVVRRSACLRQTKFPDVPVRELAHAEAPSRLTLHAADFLEFYGPLSAADNASATHGEWDAVVTSYFLDTLPDPAVAVRTIYSLLRPGGVWVNVGPLEWHDSASGLLRLSLEELLALVRHLGFSLHGLRRIRRVPYLGGKFGGRSWSRSDELLSAGTWHDLVFFRAVKAVTV